MANQIKFKGEKWVGGVGVCGRDEMVDIWEVDEVTAVENRWRCRFDFSPSGMARNKIKRSGQMDSFYLSAITF